VKKRVRRYVPIAERNRLDRICSRLRPHAREASLSAVVSRYFISFLKDLLAGRAKHAYAWIQANKAIQSCTGHA